jgi:hypothetical protein
MVATCLLSVQEAFAVCPVCTVAVGAGVGLSRWLGIDDVVTGLWIGGLVVSLSVWTCTWLEGRRIGFPGLRVAVSLSYFLVALVPLHLAGIAGSPLNTLWGVDRIVAGTAIGSLAFLAGARSYAIVKERHGGHAWFPFQKIVMPIAPLIVLSFLFYFASK